MGEGMDEKKFKIVFNIIEFVTEFETEFWFHNRYHAFAILS